MDRTDHAAGTISSVGGLTTEKEPQVDFCHRVRMSEQGDLNTSMLRQRACASKARAGSALETKQLRNGGARLSLRARRTTACRSRRHTRAPLPPTPARHRRAAPRRSRTGRRRRMPRRRRRRRSSSTARSRRSASLTTRSTRWSTASACDARRGVPRESRARARRRGATARCRERARAFRTRAVRNPHARARSHAARTARVRALSLPLRTPRARAEGT